MVWEVWSVVLQVSTRVSKPSYSLRGIKLQPSFYYFTQAFLQPRPERQRTARLSCHSHRDKVFKYLGGAQGAD